MNFMPVSMPQDIDKYFFNRINDINFINIQLSALDLNIPPQLLITGYRGVGKTFLLKKILKDQPDKYLTTYIDLLDINGRELGKLSESEVLKEILMGIKNTVATKESLHKRFISRITTFLNEFKIKDHNLSNDKEIFDIPLPEFKENYNKLSKFIMELPQNIIDSSDEFKGFIIVIDEFQLLKNLENPEALFGLIRSYTQKQFNVSYIFTGSVSRTAEIINTLNGKNGAFGGRILQYHISPFNKNETKRYIDERANNLTFTSDGFELFYEYSRGIPLYINALASILPNNVECSEEIIKQAFNLNIDQVAVMWIYVWGRLTEGEKNFIILLAENNKLDRNTINDMLNYSKSSITRYIDSLLNKGIIEFDSNTKEYSLSDKMLERWLKNRFENDGHYPI